MGRERRKEGCKGRRYEDKEGRMQREEIGGVGRKAAKGGARRRRKEGCKVRRYRRREGRKDAQGEEKRK